MECLGMQLFYLPQLSTEKPKAPHVAIYTTPPEILKTRKRVIVIVNDESQDLGVFAYRELCGSAGIDMGSSISFVKELISRSEATNAGGQLQSDTDRPLAELLENQAKLTRHTGSIRQEDRSDTNGIKVETSTSSATLPGLLISNAGQLLYSYKLNESMTRDSWNARPLPSAVHNAIQVSPENLIPDNETPEKHVEFVFKNVLQNSDIVSQDAEVYIVAMQTRGDLVLEYLNDNWSKHCRNTMAIALMDPRDLPSTATGEFAGFLQRRARAWKRSPAPLLAAIEAPTPLSAKSHNAGLDSSLTTNWSERNDWSQHQRRGSSNGSRFGTDNKDEILDLTYLKNPDYVVDDNSVTQPTFSAGDLIAGECVFPNVFRSVLDWFEEVAAAPLTYKNPVFTDLWKELEPSCEEQLGDGTTSGERDAKTESGLLTSGPVVGALDNLNLEDTADPASAELESVAHEVSAVEDATREARDEEQEVARVDSAWPIEEEVEMAGVKFPKSMVDEAGLGDSSDEEDDGATR